MWFKKKEPKFIVVDCAVNCFKDKCPKWVVLTRHITTEKGEKKSIPEGKCAVAWIPELMIELLGKKQ